MQLLCVLLLLLPLRQLQSQSLPLPDHIVVFFLEDKDYTEVVGDTNYHDTINHFLVLHTLEDLYRLVHAGSAVSVQPIT